MLDRCPSYPKRRLVLFAIIALVFLVVCSRFLVFPNGIAQRTILNSCLLQQNRDTCVIDCVAVHPWFCSKPLAPAQEIIQEMETISWSGQITDRCRDILYARMELSSSDVPCEDQVKEKSKILTSPSLPIFWNEEALEWTFFMNLIQNKVGSEFVFVELGAGVARWTVDAALVTKNYRSDLNFRGISVEAVPRTYKWMLENLERNQVADRIKPINGALWSSLRTLYADTADKVQLEGKLVRWYGQGVYENERPGTVPISGLTLESLLANHSIIDVIDADLQTSESQVFTEPNMPLLLKKVRAIFIETHEFDIHVQLLILFQRHKWNIKHNYIDDSWTMIELYPLANQFLNRTGQATRHGILNFQGGLLAVYNPELS